MASVRSLIVARSMSFRKLSTTGATPGEQHAGGLRLWKILSFTVAIPGVLICYMNARTKEKEHHEHYERPEFVPYDHLRRRTKRFPWGDGNHSLFHNHKTNALPNGYDE